MIGYKNLLLTFLLIAVIMGSFTYSPVQAASPDTTTGCTIWANSPTQKGNKLSSKGYANCGMTGRTLPHVQLCIVKKTKSGGRNITKTIKCTKPDYMGPMLGPWNASLSSVKCNGKGTYYAEVRWQELGLNDVAGYIQGIGISEGIKILATGNFGTTFAVQSKPYTYCK